MNGFKRFRDTGYFVSIDGRIYSEFRMVVRGGVLRGDGYSVCNVSVLIGGSLKRKTFYVHRMVAECFLDNPLNLPHVNHKDGNRANNAAYNLEWISSKDNHLHAIMHGRVLFNVEKRLRHKKNK